MHYDELVWQATFVDAAIGAIVELRVVRDTNSRFLGYMPQWRPFGSKRWISYRESSMGPDMARAAIRLWTSDFRTRRWWNRPAARALMAKYGHQLSLAI